MVAAPEDVYRVVAQKRSPLSHGSIRHNTWQVRLPSRQLNCEIISRFSVWQIGGGIPATAINWLQMNVYQFLQTKFRKVSFICISDPNLIIPSQDHLGPQLYSSFLSVTISHFLLIIEVGPMVVSAPTSCMLAILTEGLLFSPSPSVFYGTRWFISATWRIHRCYNLLYSAA
jgi:hypothetical protein